MTQCEKVLDYMRRNGSITAQDAFNAFGCMRLAARVSDLVKRGYRIDSAMEDGQNRYGEPTRYARYYLVSAEGEANGE